MSGACLGYGNLVPVTVEGRIFCIGFGLLGIPLILIAVTDLGKFLGENIIDLYCKYLQFVKRYNCKCCRVGGRSAADKGGDGERFLVSEPTDDQSQSLLLQELQKLGLEGYVDIPASLVFAILLSYIALGALLLRWIERWSFFDAFYFSFITMTTDARYTFINVSGKLLPLNELLKYASALQRRSTVTETLREYSEGQFRSMYFFPGAYTPRDIKRIRYIDFATSSEILLRDQYSRWERDHEVSRHTLTT
ncbi:unnamed protein product [Soboliphyme baturini]|uniref:Ion_trans_2 domain-containing protein n=1 Tax=Soboliphyme baturini TaxID=241478 RepID=A0A183J8G7_9BILA|nr:unnamed protein product [Soboliphyme baturini]